MNQQAQVLLTEAVEVNRNGKQDSRSRKTAARQVYHKTTYEEVAQFFGKSENLGKKESCKWVYEWCHRYAFQR